MFKHKTKIPYGKMGEFSKITEEYMELLDAVNQNAKIHSLIEAADLVNATGSFTWNKYHIPLLLIVLFAMIRVPYKFFRKLIYGPKK